jgi:hypothetical protein
MDTTLRPSSQLISSGSIFFSVLKAAVYQDFLSKILYAFFLLINDLKVQS